MEDNMKLVISFKYSGLLIKGASETIENKGKKQMMCCKSITTWEIQKKLWKDINKIDIVKKPFNIKLIFIILSVQSFQTIMALR